MKKKDGVLERKNLKRHALSKNASRRSDVYGLLSFVFAQEPDENFIEQLSNNRHLCCSAARGLGKNEKLWSQSLQKIVELLAVEYTRLFLGPKSHIPPFESVYNFKEGEVRQIWGSATVEVKKIIEGSGLTLKNDYGGIPDHISIELEFMQKLVKKEGEFWQRKKDDSQLFKIIELEGKFIDEHLIVWIPKFCQRVIQASELDFYRYFAGLTDDVIKSEKKEVENLRFLLMG